MLEQRILTSIIGIPIMITSLYWGGVYWQILVFLLVLVGLLEFARMGGPGIHLDYLLVAGLSYLLLTYSGMDSTRLILWFLFQTLYYLIRSAFSGNNCFASAPNLLGVFYVAVLYSFLWTVRHTFGLSWTIFGLLVTWLTDTGAYFGGTRHGKHQLAPNISPNKSIEGALIGSLSGVLTGLVYAMLSGQSLLAVGALAFVLSIAGQLGDLVESAMKRERAVKDTGSILPGHGGILDRFDSVAFVFPLLFIILTLFAPRGF